MRFPGKISASHQRRHFEGNWGFLAALMLFSGVIF